jgi:DNA-binding IclR family transcriptional regulator
VPTASATESVEGIIGLATPIVGSSGGVNAAVHISAPRGRLSPDRLPLVGTAMSRAGGLISRQLGAVDNNIPSRTVDEVVAFEKQRGARS